MQLTGKISQLKFESNHPTPAFRRSFAPKGVLRRVAMRACGCQLASSLAENHPKKNQGDIRQDPEFPPWKANPAKMLIFLFLGGGRVEKQTSEFYNKKKIRVMKYEINLPKKNKGTIFEGGKSVKIANTF